MPTVITEVQYNYEKLENHSRTPSWPASEDSPLLLYAGIKRSNRNNSRHYELPRTYRGRLRLNSQDKGRHASWLSAPASLFDILGVSV
jgi:hypothetical protein